METVPANREPCAASGAFQVVRTVDEADDDTNSYNVLAIHVNNLPEVISYCLPSLRPS